MTWADKFRVDIPEGEYDGIKIVKFEVHQHSLENIRNILDGRGTRPGHYTKLVDMNAKTSFGRDGVIWMSDVDAEVKDHLEPYQKAYAYCATHVLLNGLGLGCLLKALLTLDDIEHIDVVEKDERVIKLVGPNYNDPRVNIIHADAFEQSKAWPVGTSWSIAWHDIWPTIDMDNLPEMTRLHRSYGKRVIWQGSWAQAQCRRMAKEDKEYERMYSFLAAARRQRIS